MDVPHIAHRQAGAFTRRQASDEGVSRHATRRRLLSGRWVLLLGEVLVARETLVTPTTRAWAAHLATGGVVSHHTAGALHGLVKDDGSLHVTSRANLHALIPHVVEHRVRLEAVDVGERDGLPITARTRTL